MLFFKMISMFGVLKAETYINDPRKPAWRLGNVYPNKSESIVINILSPEA